MNNQVGNRYQILKKIGSGGMADVYLAIDTVLKREVAIKVLRGSLSHDPVALLRFQREAEAASGLDHDNIVDVYDVGEDDGHHYIVMEMIHGKTLKELIQIRGSLDDFEAVSIMEQLADALMRAHEAKVIHRDIKPQNILVKDDGTVKVADFGIALAGDAMQLTKTDSVLGSVHYLAPECSRGEGASEQSDIYALGIVFYELLVGDIPFKADSAVEIAMQHLRDPLPSVLEIRPNTPNSFVNIIAKATHKNRAYRYKNMKEFVDDLSTSLDPNRQNEKLWKPTDGDIHETLVMDKLNSIDEEPKEDEKKSKRRKNLFILSFISLGILLVTLVFLFTRTEDVTEIVMEDLQGKTLDEARSILEGQGLHINPNYVYEYSDEFEYLQIISTRPEAGATVLAGSQIRLTISQGKTLEIEDYSGMTLEEAKQALSKFNVTIRTSTEAREDIPTGQVIRQELLKPGDRVNPDQKREILLVVSSDVQVIIPSDLVGKSVNSAEKMLQDLGLKVTKEKLPVNNLSLAEQEDLNYSVVIKSNPMPGSYYVQSPESSVVLYYYDELDKKSDDNIDDQDSEGENHEED